jgi:hypothetical protein
MTGERKEINVKQVITQINELKLKYGNIGKIGLFASSVFLFYLFLGVLNLFFDIVSNRIYFTGVGLISFMFIFVLFLYFYFRKQYYQLQDGYSVTGVMVEGRESFHIMEDLRDSSYLITMVSDEDFKRYKGTESGMIIVKPYYDVIISFAFTVGDIDYNWGLQFRYDFASDPHKIIMKNLREEDHELSEDNSALRDFVTLISAKVFGSVLKAEQQFESFSELKREVRAQLFDAEDEFGYEDLVLRHVKIVNKDGDQSVMLK